MSYASNIQERLFRAVDRSIDDPSPDGLIGVFQQFRPDGHQIDDLFQGIQESYALQSRLRHIYQSTGDGRRPDGTRDAYFIVRQPPAIEPERVRELAEKFFTGLGLLANSTAQLRLARLLDPLPKLRLLEGLPPKHPRARAERAELLLALQDDAAQILYGQDDQLEPDKRDIANLLRPAYYFIAGDAFLRDYLLWPLFDHQFDFADPYVHYFELWRHKIKFRVFADRQIDLYMPRQ